MSPVSKRTLEGLNKGIQGELAAYVFYKKGMEVTRSEKLKELLANLASEEKEHYRILEGQYDSLVRSEMWVTYNDILRKPGLPDIDEKMAEVHQELLKEISDSSSPIWILQKSLMLEEKARDLYSGLAEQTEDPNGKETYRYLAKFEGTHITKIQEMLEQYK